MREMTADGSTFPVIYNGIKMRTYTIVRLIAAWLSMLTTISGWQSVRPPTMGLAPWGNQAFWIAPLLPVIMANGFPSNEAKTLVMDCDNDLWVGTDRGIAIVLNAADPTAKGAIARYRPRAVR